MTWNRILFTVTVKVLTHMVVVPPGVDLVREVLQHLLQGRDYNTVQVILLQLGHSSYLLRFSNC